MGHWKVINNIFFKLLKSLPCSLVEAPLNLSIYINCDLHFLLRQWISPSETCHYGICTLNCFWRRFKSWNFYEEKLKSCASCYKNLRSRCATFLEIWSVEVRVFSGSWNSSQRSDLGKIVITLSLSIGLEFCQNWKIVHSIEFSFYQFQRKMKKQWHVARHTNALYWNSP